MDRMEILKLAMASCKDAKEALTLAREMAAFVQDEPLPLPAKTVAAQAQVVGFIKPKPTSISSQNLLIRPKEKKHWTEADFKQAASLLDNGASYAEAGKIIGRTSSAVRGARYKGLLPVKIHTINEIHRLNGVKAAIARGAKISDTMLDLLTRPSGSKSP
jgi:hypothetical protein